MLNLVRTIYCYIEKGFFLIDLNIYLIHLCLIVVVQFLSCVRLFVTPQTAAHQASLSLTISRSLLKLMSIESMRPSNHLVFSLPLLPSIFASINQGLFQ